MIGPVNYEDSSGSNMMRWKGRACEGVGVRARGWASRAVPCAARLVTSAKGHSSAILRTVGNRLLNCAAAAASHPAATMTSLQRHRRRERYSLGKAAGGSE